jgi:hypothetical protein
MLRREFGDTITVYRLSASQTDPTTGHRTQNILAYTVRLAVVLPGQWSQQEKRGISLISANKSLVQGGQYEVGLQGFIVDSRDLPFTPSTDDWIVYNDRQYNIASIDAYEQSTSWIIGARALPGRANNQIFQLKSESVVSLTQGAQ